jgi:hypothetical protein
LPLPNDAVGIVVLTNRAVQGGSIATFARAEGLEAHARAVEIRTRGCWDMAETATAAGHTHPVG